MIFYEAIESLLKIPELRNMSNIPTYHRILNYHYGKREHLLRVSFFSYKLSSLLGLNSTDAAKAGLYHDLVTPESNNRLYAGWNHPELSAEVARKYGENKRVVSIIESHQFPLPPKPLRYPESLIVWVFDKLDVFFEFFGFSKFVDYVVSSELNKQ